MRRLLRYLILPREVTPFERAYLARINRIALVFMLLHLPVMVTLAACNGTGPGLAALLTGLVLTGPVLAYFTFENPRRVAMVFGFTSMVLGGLLVNFGRGAMQIEMHFYFFVLIALLAVFANPIVILIAAVSVAAHHLLLFFVLPESVFNYQASVWAVAVHALFVVLESVAACFVARSFFDNVIGLERIVEKRTRDLDDANQELRQIFDHVGQGLVMVDATGQLSSERSAVVERWFGTARPGATLWEVVAGLDADAGAWIDVGWAALFDGSLPLDVAVDQLPTSVVAGGRALQLEYQPVVREGRVLQVLVVISDVTSLRARERLESEQQEIAAAFTRVMRDRAGFAEYFRDAGSTVALVAAGGLGPAEELRLVHTLKGNAGLHGLAGLAAHCHQLETHMLESGDGLDAGARQELAERWASLAGRLRELMQDHGPGQLAVDDEDLLELRQAIAGQAPSKALLELMDGWRLEPVQRRLTRIAHQAEGIAERLGKGPLDIAVRADALRLDPERWAPFWAAFVHLVRNAIDHGLEDAAERVAAGKAPRGQLQLSSEITNGQLVVSIHDDGRGVDWGQVARKARAMGLPTATAADLEEALFADGLSTRQEADELSGRGVGMGSLRAVCREQGGDVRVTSEPGRGTGVRCHFPLLAMASPRAARPGLNVPCLPHA